MKSVLVALSVFLVLGAFCPSASAEGATVPGTTTVPAAAEKPLTLKLADGVEMKLVQIPAGTFTMGSPETEKDRFPDEIQHEVTITKPFYMGKYEVTQAQYQAVMGENPSTFNGDKNPVENVSWEEAVSFCKKLSEKTGKTVRLPTEAEWEYACRAGSKTRFSFGDADEDLHKYGTYCDSSNTLGLPWQDKAHSDGFDKTAPVGSLTANKWGLYDMHGNVWEWVSDWYGAYEKGAATDPTGAVTGNGRVLRGGSWYYSPSSCRSALRLINSPDHRNLYDGFRVVSVAGVD